MVTLVFLSVLVMQVAMPGEMSCVGFIRDDPVPMNLYVSGTEEDEINNYSHTGTLLYVNGPGVPALKAGELFTVVRPEGRLRDRVTGDLVGVYHKELGTVRIEATRGDGATASVVQSCAVILKGDLLIPVRAKPTVKFDGKLSDHLTPYNPQGLQSTIVIGKNGIQEMAAGDFCFVPLGSRDGVKPGDRFTIFRPQPPFDAKHLEVDGSMAGLSYERVRGGRYRQVLIDTLSRRSIPPRVLGDLVVIDVFDTASAAKIVNSLSEVHVGDVVVRR
jgi:hypothetical protein